MTSLLSKDSPKRTNKVKKLFVLSLCGQYGRCQQFLLQRPLTGDSTPSFSWISFGIEPSPPPLTLQKLPLRLPSLSFLLPSQRHLRTLQSSQGLLPDQQFQCQSLGARPKTYKGILCLMNSKIEISHVVSSLTNAFPNTCTKTKHLQKMSHLHGPKEFVPTSQYLYYTIIENSPQPPWRST